MENFKQLHDDVKDMVADFGKTNLTFTSSDSVPNIEDTRLTYGNGEEKKGIVIETCVLYVDIRKSVEMSKKYSYKTMGKVFSGFTRAVQMAAKKHNGFIRNIIGDRVMVIFPKENCFTNAVECAISINHLMKYAVNKQLNSIDFQCGIGIDCGKMYCIKVGKKEDGAENIENKGLVWVGLPANQASRLTDCANKEYPELIYRVKNFIKKWSLQRNNGTVVHPLQTNNSEYIDDVMTGDEAVNRILEGKSIRIEPVSKLDPYMYKPILISESVFEGYKKECPNCNSIKNSWWEIEQRHIRDIDFNVYGADLIWDI